jgi:hypothetical protein
MKIGTLELAGLLSAKSATGVIGLPALSSIQVRFILSSANRRFGGSSTQSEQKAARSPTPK